MNTTLARSRGPLAVIAAAAAAAGYAGRRRLMRLLRRGCRPTAAG